MSRFALTPATAGLGDLQFAGKVLEMAFRLRGSGVSTLARVGAIGVDAGISGRELAQMVLPTLESLGWVHLSRGSTSAIEAVEDSLPPFVELLNAGPRLLATVGLDAFQSAALGLLEATTLQPLEQEAALDAVAEFGAEAAQNALDCLAALNLVFCLTADDGRSAVFNPNVWVDKEAATQAALRTEDANVRREVGALLEEVSQAPGLPQEQVESTEARWIDFAVSQGLIERNVVSTSTGIERSFLFSPHMARDSFGSVVRDASGHVRQLVGSMVYAATYPRWKLSDPALFVQRLIERGTAGDASPIGTDYPMLETAGIVRVVPGSRADKFSLELRQSDIAESALTILRTNQSFGGQATENRAAGLFSQKTYRHTQGERARLAVTVPADDRDMARMVAALRQESRRNSG